MLNFVWKIGLLEVKKNFRDVRGTSFEMSPTGIIQELPKLGELHFGYHNLGRVRD
jgi:hypothetical protein